MPVTVQPCASEARENATFEALLWALSRPGHPRMLPEPGLDAIIDALLDRECRVHASDPLLVPRIMRTGAEIADIDVADHVFLGATPKPEVLSRLAVGSDLYPDGGATVFVTVTLGEGAALRLTGPGVNGACDLRVAGLADGFWQARAARSRYPMGFDLFIQDGARIIGVPRSTCVEVLK
ncbi:MAG: phosphonate C-P lyase system protein PhnH [Pseudomonadota bacterium]